MAIQSVARSSRHEGASAFFFVLAIFLLSISTYAVDEATAELDASQIISQLFQQANDSEPDLAKAAYEQIVEQFPGTAEALEAQKRLTVLHIELGEAAESDAAADKLVNDFAEIPNVSDAIYKVARQYAKATRTDKAIELFNKVAQDNPQSAIASKTYPTLSKLHIKQGDLSNAELMVSKLLSDYPSSLDIPKAILGIARAYSKNGEKVKAINHFKKIIQDYSQTEQAITACSMLAKASIEQGNFNDADLAISKLVADYSDSPTTPEAILFLGHAYGRKDEKSKAIDNFKKIIQSYPQSEQAAKACAMLASTEAKNGNYDEADSAIAKLLADYPDSPLAAKSISHVARVYKDNGMEDKAIPLFTEVIENYPESEYAMWAHFRRAKIGGIPAVMPADKTLADSIWPTALCISNDCINGDNADEFRDAVESFFNDFEDSNDLPLAAYLVAEKLYIAGLETNSNDQKAEAERLFRRAIAVSDAAISKQVSYTSYNKSAELYLIPAESYRVLKEYDNALPYYEIILEKWPDNKYGDHVPTMVEICKKKLSSDNTSPAIAEPLQLQEIDEFGEDPNLAP